MRERVRLIAIAAIFTSAAVALWVLFPKPTTSLPEYELLQTRPVPQPESIVMCVCVCMCVCVYECECV